MSGPPAVRAYFVEDNPTIRENLIATLEELGGVAPVGYAETEHQGSEWLVNHTSQWDLAIVDLFLKQGSGLGVLQATRERNPDRRWSCSPTTPRPTSACAATSWAWTRCSTNPTTSRP